MKTEAKDLGMETRPGEEVLKEENFHTIGNPLTGTSVGSFVISEDNITGEKYKYTHTYTYSL